jgi:hypothetical protein
MNKYFKAACSFGIIGGLFCGFAFFVMYSLDKDPISFTEVFGYAIIPVFVFLGIKNFKDRLNEGELSFGQAMTVGFFVYSILALISAMSIFIFIMGDPEVIVGFRTSNLELLKENKEVLMAQLDQASYDRTYDNIYNMTVFDVAFNDFLRKIFPGLFYTIIISIILKRTKI